MATDPKMIEEVEYAELHAPLFIAGKNLQTKLDPARVMGLVLKFDEDKNRLLVFYGGKEAEIPEANIALFIRGVPKLPGHHHKPAAVPSITAQVSSPQDHVFAGPGAGKSR